MSTRKLNITLQFSAEDDYEGGDLEFMSSGNVPRPRGSFVVFPAFMMRRVTRFTRRWTLLYGLLGSWAAISLMPPI